MGQTKTLYWKRDGGKASYECTKASPTESRISIVENSEEGAVEGQFVRTCRPAVDAPLGTPARCVELAARGLQAWAIVDLALVDDGGAVSAYEVQRRRTLLQPLGRAARRAIVAACSPEVWPPA